MSNKNLVINNFDFAKKEQTLSGALRLSEVPRLGEWFDALGALPQKYHDDEVLRYTLSGSSDHSGKQFLNLDINFSMDLVCQRCLQPMQKTLALNYDYLITAMTEEELLGAEEDPEEEMDVVTQDKAMDVRAMIVDEVIAAIPYAPMHEELCKALKVEAGEKANPFAVLKGLKKDLS